MRIDDFTALTADEAAAMFHSREPRQHVFGDAWQVMTEQTIGDVQVAIVRHHERFFGFTCSGFPTDPWRLAQATYRVSVIMFDAHVCLAVKRAQVRAMYAKKVKVNDRVWDAMIEQQVS